MTFIIPLPKSTATDQRHPDKPRLRAQILALRERGLSYREIGAALGIHFTRVGQIIKSWH